VLVRFSDVRKRFGAKIIFTDLTLDIGAARPSR
jgi:ABC-type transporter Mla maintaining outer membrane lipid asymmetry ATPase subunit MlaF